MPTNFLRLGSRWINLALLVEVKELAHGHVEVRPLAGDRFHLEGRDAEVLKRVLEDAVTTPVGGPR
jgi:hypothetical protein